MPPINPYNCIVNNIKQQYYCIKAFIAKQLPVLGGQISKHKHFIVNAKCSKTDAQEMDTDQTPIKIDIKGNFFVTLARHSSAWKASS